MSQCPKCGTGLKEDYGMVACPACGAILFVDMDGNAHIGDELDPLPPRTSATEDAAELSEAYETMAPRFELTGPLDAVESGPDEPSSGLHAHSDVEPLALTEGPAPFQIENQNPFAVGASDVAFEPLPIDLPFELPDMSERGAEPATAGMLSEEDPLGLNSFANSELSSAKDGLLMCRLFIAGVDTKEIREALRASMDDARFNWDPSEILSHLKSGHLTMDNVTPVKATILINRIKQLPLRIRWEQYTIAQARDDASLD